MTQMYQLNLTATGEVRDKDGNVIGTLPIETSVEVTEEQLLDFLKEQQEQ